jgi:hypothetical protein
VNRSLTPAVAAFGALAVVGAGACAHASPQPVPPGPAQTTPPQPGSACGDTLDGALTALPQPAGITGNAKTLLQCGDGTWRPFVDAYPSSDRWLTTGPELILHGQGLQNPEAKAGTWTASPQTTETRCSAESVDVVAAGQTSQPQTFTADPGRPLTFDVSDHMFTVKLSGYCLWRRG